MITNGHSTDWRGRPYRRRRLVPGLVVAAVLAAMVVIAWAFAFNTTGRAAQAVSCNPPAAGGDGAAPPGHRAQGALAGVAPAPLWNTQVRVFNANGQSGQAAHVAATLSDEGFGSATDNPIANDPVYVQQDLRCQGQIRFGTNGEAAAAALDLVMPCAELIRDDRTDATVDLALGTLFNDLSPNADAEAALKALRVPEGADAPHIDPALISGAHNVRC